MKLKTKSIESGKSVAVRNKQPDEPQYGIVLTDPKTGKAVKIKLDPQKLAGNKSPHFAQMLLQQTTATVPRYADDIERGLTEVCNTLEGLEPRNTLEGMLCAQMAGAHNLSLEFMRRSLLPGQTIDEVTSQTNRAVRLMRMFVEQVDALQRVRGKTGQQTVTVEHVHVHQGGQAIVGAVRAPGRDQGDGKQNRRNTP